MRWRSAYTLAFVLVAAGCAAGTEPAGPSTAARSLLTGTVLASPGCPGPQRIDQPCPGRPVVGGAVELLTGQTQVGATTTGPNGRFQFLVPPGLYTLIARNPGYPSSVSQQVDVSGSVDVTLVVDSGMR